MTVLTILSLELFDFKSVMNIIIEIYITNFKTPYKEWIYAHYICLYPETSNNNDITLKIDNMRI